MSVETAIEFFIDFSFRDLETQMRIGDGEVFMEPVNSPLTSDYAPGTCTAVHFSGVAALRWTISRPSATPRLDSPTDEFRGSCTEDYFTYLYDDVGMARVPFGSGIRIEFFFRDFEIRWLDEA